MGDAEIRIENETLEGLAEKEHSSLTDVGASDHHAKTVSSEIDHGSVDGLSDDDHTQYVLATGARAMGELRLTPKTSSSGPEGTVFYDSDDDHVYVATE